MRGVINRAIANPKRVVFPEGEELKIMRAAAICVDEGIAVPVLLGNPEVICARAKAAGIPLDDITIENPATSPQREEYAAFLSTLRERKGMSLEEARRRLFNGNYFGSCMVACGHSDALVSGVSMHYPETIRPALEVIGARSPRRLRQRHVQCWCSPGPSSCSAPTPRSTSTPRPSNWPRSGMRRPALAGHSGSSPASRCCRFRILDRSATRVQTRWHGRSRCCANAIPR